MIKTNRANAYLCCHQTTENQDKGTCHATLLNFELPHLQIKGITRPRSDITILTGGERSHSNSRQRAKSSSLKITSPKTGPFFFLSRLMSHCIWVDRTAIVWVRPWDLFNYYSIKRNCQWSQWEFNLKGEVGSGTRETFTPWPCRSYFCLIIWLKSTSGGPQVWNVLFLTAVRFCEHRRFCQILHMFSYMCLILLGSIPKQPGSSLKDIRWSGQMTASYIWTYSGTACLALKRNLNSHHL